MTSLTEQQIDQIAQRVIASMGGAARGATLPRSAMAKGGSPAAWPAGLHANIDAAVNAARDAFKAFSGLSVAKRGEIIAAIRRSMLDHAEELAREAREETGIGRAEDK